MRILHISTWYIPYMGYQENYLMAEQKKLGHEVQAIVPDRHPLFINYLRFRNKIQIDRITNATMFNDKGVIIHRLPTLFEIPLHGQRPMKGLKKKLKEIKPDVIQVHGVVPLSTIQTLLCQKNIGSPIFLDAHVGYFNLKPYKFHKKLYYQVLRYFFFPIFIERIEKIFAISKDAQNVLIRELGIPTKKIEFLPLGADHKKFKFNKKDRKEVREKLGIEDDEIVGIYAGKLVPTKEIIFLINSCKNLFKKFGNFKLLLLGSGPDWYLNDIQILIRKEKLKDRVLLHPYVKNDELPKFYSAADIGIWPGDPSITIIEAMSCSLPIIIQKSLSTDHLIKGNGFSFDKGNIRQFQKYLEYLIKNDNDRKKMGNISRKLVEKEFNWEKIAKKSIKYYEEAISRSR